MTVIICVDLVWTYPFSLSSSSFFLLNKTIVKNYYDKGVKPSGLVLTEANHMITFMGNNEYIPMRSKT